MSKKFERAIFDKILEQMTLAQGKHNLCTKESVSRLFDIINTNNDRLLSFADVQSYIYQVILGAHKS